MIHSPQKYISTELSKPWYEFLWVWSGFLTVVISIICETVRNISFCTAESESLGLEAWNL